MQSREKPTVKLSIAAGKRIELNELDARFNADEFWREGDPLTKTVHVAESDEAELIEKLKNHPDVLVINGKSIKREIKPSVEPEAISSNNTAMLFSHPKVRIHISMSTQFNLEEIDPRLPGEMKIAHSFPFQASFFVEKADEAELIEKLKRDERIFSVNKNYTEAGIAYHQQFSAMYKITQVK